MSAPESSYGPSKVSSQDSSIAVKAGTASVSRRDARLDFFRGLALLTIFINHIPGTPYEQWTSRNFGFSDAAEAFFIMSGIAAALAYSRRFHSGTLANSGLWSAIAPIWSRAWTLYLVHLALTAWAIAIFAGAADLFAIPELLTQINLRAIFTNPLATFTGIPLLTHQLGYVNILPVYAVLLAITPLLIPLAQRAPLRLAVGSALLWFIAGQQRLNFPNYPNPGGWFFNPYAWQAVFITGLLIGTALSRGERLLPIRRNGIVLCAMFLLLSLMWRQVPDFGDWCNRVMWQLGKLGLPFHMVGHDKTFLALPRLLHVLALTYLLSALPGVRRLTEMQACGWLRLLGRQGLLVFASGTLLAIFSQALLAAFPDAHWLVLAIVPMGIVVQLGVAWLAERASLASTTRIVARERILLSNALTSDSVTHLSTGESSVHAVTLPTS